MDIVADLVTDPFKEIIEKGNVAMQNVGENKEMLCESQRVVRSAERCLKMIEPLCARHLKKSEAKFTDALKDNNDIAEFRLQLTDALWDFDEYTEADTFDKAKYDHLWELCKKSGVGIAEILKRMKLESAPTNPPITASPLEEKVERRPPMSTLSSPTSEPNVPGHEIRLSHGSSHRVDTGAVRLLTDEERCLMSPQDVRSPDLPLGGESLPPQGRTLLTFLAAPIPENPAFRPNQPPQRYSQASSIQSQESLHSSIFDGRRKDGATSPSTTERRISAASGHDDPMSPMLRGPTIPPNFPPGIHEGIEPVPLVMDDREGPIPVESELSQSIRPPSMQSTRQRECSIGLRSSFYLHKGFCEGAKEVVRGSPGIKVVKKPVEGFSGAHVVAKCASCCYEVDLNQIQQDVNYSDEANYTLNKIGFRLRFLQKSHIPTKRADEILYGCVFCVHSQNTLEESDATVFFSQKKLFEHLARHPRPLPQVPGITVIEETKVPINLKNNYDLHLRLPPTPSPLANKQLELARLPNATAMQTVRRMNGIRLLYGQMPAFELANGARLSGVEFPAKYNGEWVVAWHEGNYGSTPADVLKLEPPPKAEIKTDKTSSICAIARWRFAPKSKDGGDWLKFEVGEKITNISWAWQDHWCWSGTNAKGVWGIFPQTHIDINTIRENTDRSSISSSERKKTERFFGRLTRLKSSQGPPAVAEVMVSSGPRPSVV